MLHGKRCNHNMHPPLAVLVTHSRSTSHRGPTFHRCAERSITAVVADTRPAIVVKRRSPTGIPARLALATISVVHHRHPLDVDMGDNDRALIVALSIAVESGVAIVATQAIIPC